MGERLMSGETNLDALLGGMKPRLHAPVFAFATVERAPVGVEPLMVFREAEGVTLVAEADTLEAAGIAYTFRCRMITLEIHSALEAVGFLAKITACLARAGIGVNPVAAFYHDHLFVPEDRAEEAQHRLLKLAREHLA